MCNDKKQHCHGEHGEEHAHIGNGGHQHAHDDINSEEGHVHHHVHEHNHPHGVDHDTEHGHSHEGNHEHPHVHEHAHPHGHEHPHPHGHSHGEGGHCHKHEEKKGHCGCGCGEPVEKKDEEILEILLDHWVAHNKDHAGEYNTWVEKMNRLGKNDVAEDLIEAIALMAEADKHLIQAKKDLVK